ncbi:MAG: peptidase M1 [Bacteroidetes bacterium]|nr:MAG: peptidase M1 [Bacteroidota bacterium]
MRLVFVILLLVAFSPSREQNLISGGKLRPEQAIMDIRHYTVSLDVNIEKQTIAGMGTVDFIFSQPSNIIVLDLVHLMNVEKVWVNKKPAAFKHDDDLLTITPTATLPAGKVKVEVQYSGKPGVAARPPWDGGFTWTKDSTGNPWVAVTSEGEGGKIFFPCKDHPSDEPNEGADLIVTVPKGLVVAGPGLLQKVTTKKDKSTYHWKTNYTINNYSIIFNIGKFKVVTRQYTSISGKIIPMQFYVLEEHTSHAEHQLEMLEKTVKMDEKYFGEYPWANEKIAICETPHLGMEHQTMNAYGNKFRYTQVGGSDFDWLMHHEFGHEWWGNKITAKDWGHYWIQEGICSFADALYNREYEGEESYLKRMERTARATRNEKPVVLGDSNVTEDDAYHPDIYGKGAFFMHTLRYVLGDDVFFPTLKKFATSPQYTYDNQVTTTDVEKFFSKESGKDLKPLFDFYLRTIQKLEIDIKQLDDSKYHVKILNFDMPLPMEIVTDAGSQKVTLDKKGTTITSKTIPQIDPKVYYLKKIILE